MALEATAPRPCATAFATFENVVMPPSLLSSSLLDVDRAGKRAASCMRAPKDFDDGLADHPPKEDLPCAEEGLREQAGSARREHKADLVPSEEGEMG